MAFRHVHEPATQEPASICDLNFGAIPDALFAPVTVRAHSVFSCRSFSRVSIQHRIGAIGAGELHRLSLSMFAETLELGGHIVDSLTLQKVLRKLVFRGAP